MATAASVAIAAILFATFFANRGGVQEALWFLLAAVVAAPAAAGGAIWTRILALQLLARATWWVLLLYAGFILATGATDGRVIAIAVASACALLAAGRVDLDGDAGRFKPGAFRGTLTVMLVLAMADAGSFAWIALIRMVDGHIPLMIVFVPPMIAAVIGLLRLRTWGLLVSVACNVVVAVLAAADLLGVADKVRWIFIGSAVVQLLIPLPMWLTIVRNARLRGRQSVS